MIIIKWYSVFILSLILITIVSAYKKKEDNKSFIFTMLTIVPPLIYILMN